LSEYEGLADKRAIRLECRCESEDLEAQFDAEKMGQVVRNLVSNAIKFSPDGGLVLVTLAHTELADGVPGLLLSVRDNGPGIPDDELEAVFDKFVQSSRNSKSAGGTGLGLAIAREVVNAHQGSICARNNDDGGSHFRVAIPRHHAAADK
jgi:signal transduction histidine kinase